MAIFVAVCALLCASAGAQEDEKAPATGDRKTEPPEIRLELHRAEFDHRISRKLDYGTDKHEATTNTQCSLSKGEFPAGAYAILSFPVETELLEVPFEFRDVPLP
ncbi:MAG: hypothetical protein JXR37_35165 [Kiritimatiellae bacterium]|nr:hypothetical protein [Kiritimatiellia bacterium]